MQMIPTLYTPDYEIAIQKAMSVEGGYIDHPNDSAGPTNMGITISALSAYNKKSGKDWTIPTLTKDQAREFYFDEYWIPLRLHEINTQELQNVVFATAINRGSFAAIHSLQYCANMPQNLIDGKMGPKTLAYVNAEVDQKWLVNRYCNFHLDFYKRLARMWYAKDPNYEWRPVERDYPGAVQKNLVFEKGWTRRINSFLL